MAITAEQREARRHHLGSSDAAAIMGLDPWRNAGDVYWSKVMDTADEESAPMRVGNLLEDAICQFAAQELGVELERNVSLASPDDGGILSANLDARIVGRPEGVEAKYSSFIEGWGDEGTDQVPHHVLVQCQHQAHVAGLDRVWVPALLLHRRAEFRLYCVDRHDELIEQLVAEELRFWREHVEPRIPPADRPVPPLPALKRLRREPASVVTLSAEAADVLTRWEAAKAAAKAAEEHVEAAQAAVLMLLGEAEAGRLPDGRALTYLEQKSAPRCDTKLLRALAPEIAEQVVTQGTHRVLRVKKAA